MNPGRVILKPTRSLIAAILWRGMFAYTMDFVDIATGWTEQRVLRGKGERGVLDQIQDVEYMLPFPGFDADHGQ